MNRSVHINKSLGSRQTQRKEKVNKIGSKYELLWKPRVSAPDKTNTVSKAAHPDWSDEEDEEKLSHDMTGLNEEASHSTTKVSAAPSKISAGIYGVFEGTNDV